MTGAAFRLVLIAGLLPVAAATAQSDRTASAVRRLELRQDPGETVVRLGADGPLEAAAVVRAGTRFGVLLPFSDLSEVTGGWNAATNEVVAVRVGADNTGGAGLELELRPGVSCDLDRRESGLEVRCRAEDPPEAIVLPLTDAVASEPASGPDDGPDPEPSVPEPTDTELSDPEDVASPDAGGDPDADPRGEAPNRDEPATPVSLDFRDADLRDVLRILSEVSGYDFVLQPGVTGRVSVRLTETPWDQALEVILRSHRLGYLTEGGVLRVGPLPDLVEERRDLQLHAEARDLAGEIVAVRRRLAYVRPEEVREVLEARLSERGVLVADPRTGTVLLRDVRSRVEEITDLMDALDIPVPGVEIEARIVLASRTLSQELGIQWGGGLIEPRTGKRFPQSVVVGGDAIGSGTSSFATPGSGGVLPPADEEGARPGYGVDLPISDLPTGALGLALGALDGLAHLDFVLAAAERDGEVRILSAPRIVAQNARPATIKQGVTFPVQVVANNTVTVQFQDAVLELTVTPQVSPGGTVLLDLEVSNDSLDFGQAVGGIPSIVTQRATTRVRVADGETTVVGGVFARRESDRSGRVPGLHRIPLLGHLFRSREESRRDDELLIFLTPRIR